MSEVAALLNAFETEFGKALGSLPPLSDISQHDAYLNHSRGAVRVSELISYYASKLPQTVSISKILSYGDKLMQRGEYAIARDSCYSYITSLDGKSSQTCRQDHGRMDSQQRLSHYIQAAIGEEVCQASISLQSDPSFKHPRTLAQVSTPPSPSQAH